MGEKGFYDVRRSSPPGRADRRRGRAHLQPVRAPQPLVRRRRHRGPQLLGVHAPRQQRLQSGVDQPAQVPARGRHLRRRELQRHRRRRVHCAGDPGGQRRLPDREDRRELAAVTASSGLGYANLGRAAHGPGPALRLRRGPRLGGVDHRAHDGPRLRRVGPHRRRAWAPSRASTTTAKPCSTCCRCTGPRWPRSTRSWSRWSCSSAAQEAWDDAVELGEQFGVRNSQASVLAPTGTIALMLDCDTTGVEPDLGLVKTKKLVGGGTMSIVNQTVPRALAQARLHAGADRRHHLVHRRAQVDRGGAAPESRPPARCSPARWATTPSTTLGPHPHDGGGAALPVAAR